MTKSEITEELLETIHQLYLEIRDTEDLVSEISCAIETIYPENPYIKEIDNQFRNLKILQKKISGLHAQSIITY